jgi:hypothetical protein
LRGKSLVLHNPGQPATADICDQIDADAFIFDNSALVAVASAGVEAPPVALIDTAEEPAARRLRAAVSSPKLESDELWLQDVDSALLAVKHELRGLFVAIDYHA